MIFELPGKKPKQIYTENARAQIQTTKEIQSDWKIKKMKLKK